MDSFISALFSLLLGWIRGTAQWLWNLMNSDSTGGLIGWAVRNWLPLVILLCIFGMAADFVVYLIRWQPYRVWARYFSWLLPKKLRKTPTGRQLLYADGRMVEETVTPEHPHLLRKEKPVQQTGSRKRVIPAQRSRFASTQNIQTPPPLTLHTPDQENE